MWRGKERVGVRPTGGVSLEEEEEGKEDCVQINL